MDVETGAPMDKREALDEQVTRNVSLDAANPGMRATGGDGASDRVRDAGPESKMWRRGLLKKALGATAAAALLAVAKEATPAEATSRTTLVGGSTSTGNFGIAAAVDVFDPATLLPNVAGLGFGVIGTFGSPGYAPPFNAGVLGQGAGAFYGVIGLSENNPGVWGQSTGGPGVVGRSSSQPGVRGESTNSFGVLGSSPTSYGVYGVSTSGAGVFGSSTTGFGV